MRHSLWPLVIFFGRENKTACHVTIGKLWGTLLWKIFIGAKNFRLFGEEFLAWFSKRPLFFQRNNIREVFIQEIVVFYLLRTLKGDLSALSQIFVNTFVKSVFYLSRGTFWGTIFFFAKTCSPFFSFSDITQKLGWNYT